MQVQQHDKTQKIETRMMQQQQVERQNERDAACIQANQQNDIHPSEQEATANTSSRQSQQHLQR